MSQLIKRVSITLETCTLGWVDHSQLPRVWASNYTALLLRRPIGFGCAGNSGESSPKNWGCVGHFASRPLQGTEMWRIERSLFDGRLPELFCYLCYFIRSHSLSFYNGKGHPIICHESEEERHIALSIHNVRA